MAVVADAVPSPIAPNSLARKTRFPSGCCAAPAPPTQSGSDMPGGSASRDGLKAPASTTAASRPAAIARRWAARTIGEDNAGLGESVARREVTRSGYADGQKTGCRRRPPAWRTCSRAARSARFVFSILVKNLGQWETDRTVVGVGGHDVAHVAPPPAADFRLGDRLPPGIVLYLHVGEKVPGSLVMEDRVVVRSVRAQHFGKVGPDRIVAPAILAGLAGID